MTRNVNVSQFKPLGVFRHDAENITDHQRSLEVEAILQHALIDPLKPEESALALDFKYLVKWKNVPETNPRYKTWVAAADFDTTEIIQRYWKRRNKDTPMKVP